VLFVGTAAFIVYRDWNTIHAVSSFVECLVLLMKMHSYIRTKLELARRDHTVPTQTLQDFTMYLLYPTLVYEPKFPRTDKIRWGYLAEKLVANTLAMCLLYIIVTDHVMPSLEDAGISNPVFVVLHLLLPFLGVYLMLWFIIFECVLNGIAEVTYMGDRDFYEDWWNCTTFDEFARKWNKPVHEFLLRHVYLESLETYKLSRRSASTLTFFLSALIHECVFCIVFRTVKMYFFVLQMLQVVVIIYGRGLKDTRLGNYIFWCAMILGLPLQAVLYCREYHGGEPIFLNLMMPVMMAGFLCVAVPSVLMVGKKKPVKTA
jgi:sterol O-acyltransferase